MVDPCETAEYILNQPNNDVYTDIFVSSDLVITDA